MIHLRKVREGQHPVRRWLLSIQGLAFGGVPDLSRVVHYRPAFFGRLSPPRRVTPADVDALRKSGISEQAIYDGIVLCAATSIMNRVVDALGCAALTPRQRARAGRLLVQIGYAS